MDPQSNVYTHSNQAQIGVKLQVETYALQNQQELRIISQYLDFNGGIKFQNNLGQAQKAQSWQNSSSQGKTQSSKSSASDNSLEPCKKASVFHNFQKHLINTLKTSIRLKKIRNLQTSRLKLSYQLWQYFINSTKITKKFLHSILGNNLINNQLFKNNQLSSLDSFFLDEFKDISDEEIYFAQDYLRNQVVKQSKKLFNGALLKGRRLQRGDQFKKYFQEFIQELQNGNLNLRMPKLKKRQPMVDESGEQKNED